MKFRKDITDYLIQNKGSDYKKKTYKIYEKENILYMAEYEYGKNKISRYGCYSLLWHESDKEIKNKIEEKFKVKFSNKNIDIVCRCGESKSFSSFYGSYEILLRCNNCGNEFSAYSG